MSKRHTCRLRGKISKMTDAGFLNCYRGVRNTSQPPKRVAIKIDPEDGPRCQEWGCIRNAVRVVAAPAAAAAGK